MRTDTMPATVGRRGLFAAVTVLSAAATMAVVFLAPSGWSALAVISTLAVAGVGWARGRMWGAPALIGWLIGVAGVAVWWIFALSRLGSD